MGKDKHTFNRLLKENKAFLKELRERCESDCDNVLQMSGPQKSLCRQCWLEGFQYAEERIVRILESIRVIG